MTAQAMSDFAVFAFFLNFLWMFEPSDGRIWIMKYTFSEQIMSALAIPDIDKMLLAVHLIIIRV